VMMFIAIGLTKAATEIFISSFHKSNHCAILE